MLVLRPVKNKYKQVTLSLSLPEDVKRTQISSAGRERRKTESKDRKRRKEEGQ